MFTLSMRLATALIFVHAGLSRANYLKKEGVTSAVATTDVVTPAAPTPTGSLQGSASSSMDDLLGGSTGMIAGASVSSASLLALGVGFYKWKRKDDYEERFASFNDDEDDPVDVDVEYPQGPSYSASEDFLTRERTDSAPEGPNPTRTVTGFGSAGGTRVDMPLSGLNSSDEYETVATATPRLASGSSED